MSGAKLFSEAARTATRPFGFIDRLFSPMIESGA